MIVFTIMMSIPPFVSAFYNVVLSNICHNHNHCLHPISCQFIEVTGVTEVTEGTEVTEVTEVTESNRGQLRSTEVIEVNWGHWVQLRSIKVNGGQLRSTEVTEVIDIIEVTVAIWVTKMTEVNDTRCTKKRIELTLKVK